LNRYIHHHQNDPTRQRVDFGLRTYFHFEVSDEGNCFRTDGTKVGPLHDKYGFPDVPRTPGLIARYIQPTTPAIAAQSKRYAGLSSEFAHLIGPAPLCFSFHAPRPTVSTLRTQLWSGYRDDLATNQAQTWRPIKTDIVISRLPNGSVAAEVIRWKN
jgi:hypothetical protein